MSTYVSRVLPATSDCRFLFETGHGVHLVGVSQAYFCKTSQDNVALDITPAYPSYPTCFIVQPKTTGASRAGQRASPEHIRRQRNQLNIREPNVLTVAFA